MKASVHKSADRLRIDAAAECIWRDGEKIGVPPKAFLVLRRLMERAGQLVTKNELIEAVWPNTYVTERVLNNAVGQLRQALGDSSKQPRFIETVHRRGFRWIGPLNAAVAPAPAASLEPSRETAFVGRAESLDQLARCYARAAAGQRQLALVSGEPGIGKTALVDEFMSRSPPSLLARGQCIETYGAGDLYRPLREAVEQLLRDGGDETRALFRKHAPSWLLSCPEFADPEELKKLRRNVIATTSESVQRELERAIEAASDQRTIVLVLEDLHWSDPATVTLLWALAARREPAKLLIIGTYRSADAIAHQHPIIRLKHELTAKRRCVELALDGLPSDTVGAFLERHYPHHDLPAALAERLYEQTAGNPLFLLNALADLEQRGWLKEQDSIWRCSVDLDAISAAVPESTRDLIAFRLDQLSPDTRAMLETASLVGGTFATQTVAAATERGCADVEAALDPLAHAALFLKKGDDIAWPDGTRGCHYEFRHALYRQVLLRGITPARRQMLHQRIALGLERGYGERVAEIAAVLSLHHEQAGDTFRAVDYIEMLVQQANARSSAHEAEAMLKHAIGLLQRAPEQPARQQRLRDLTIQHGFALGTVRGFGSAESLRAFEDARALGQSLPSAPEHLDTLGGVAIAKAFGGHFREAYSLAEELLARARVDASPNTLVTAHTVAGSTLIYLGNIAAALEHAERAVAAATVPSSDALESASYLSVPPAYICLALASCLAGRLQRARAAVQSAVQIARTVPNPWSLAHALSMAASVAWIRRDLAECRQFATEALTVGLQSDVHDIIDGSRFNLGWAAVLESRDPTLIEPLRTALEGYRARIQISVSSAYGAFADACLAVERINDAAQALESAFDLRGEDRSYDSELLRLRAMVLLGRAKSSRSKSRLRQEAEQTLEQAIEVANTQGNRLFGLRATVDLCRLWLAAGKSDQARQRLTEALSGFDDSPDETDVREASALLETCK